MEIAGGAVANTQFVTTHLPRLLASIYRLPVNTENTINPVVSNRGL
jgi:hypothetical protein